MAQEIKTVLFACVHNAGRSQMAAAFFNLLADSARARAISAGTQPAERVHPEVVRAMAELRVDLSHAKPTLLSEQLATKATILITMGCGESCPLVPGLRREDWEVADPKGQDPGTVRQVRDEIRRRVARLIAREGWDHSVFGTEMRAIDD